jgi:hypothetical protein
MKIILMRTISFMTRLLERTKVLIGKKKTLFFINFLLLFAVLTFFNTACSKHPSIVGADLMPDNALSMHLKQDTFRVYSVLNGSVRADKLSINFLGSMEDSVFGLTNASFYTKIVPISLGRRFGDHPKTDSLILQLKYDHVYGDTNARLRVHVYEMKDNIYFDSVYFSDKKVAVYPTDYADETFRPDKDNYYLFPSGINDTLMDTVKGVLRINLSHLSTAMGDKLLQADTTIQDSSELFLEYFKGLYVTVDDVVNGKGALASFLSNTPNTRLILYYHNDAHDSLEFHYIMASTVPKINQYEHNYSTADPDFIRQVINGDTALGQQKFYLQGLAGVKTIIKFPHIRDLNKLGTIGINEARLILPGSDTTTSMDPPPELSLLKIDSDTSYSKLPDVDEGSDFFGGIYDKNSNSYSFRITHYIVSLLKDSTIRDKGLVLFVKSGFTNPRSFVFNGPEFKGDSSRRAQLNILYTIIQDH